MLVLGAPAVADDGCGGAHAPGDVKLTVQVNGVRPAVGEVAITVYPDDKRRFLARGGKYARQRVKAAASVRACFWVPPAGYAVAVYHDANGDHNFARTLVGLPDEGFGFSNDPETRVGLPPLSAVRFMVGRNDRSIAVQMRYLR
ncbi:DUF2141 domain-containing protein [Phenylobacterium sp.]|uniref:DUF2141 domain-containing protein n=1 Tax=Phenylobacterium sp. TaxID=1871053 RepID=UPI0025DA7914|nr:DUF2141 domain-containing protein [Phenylobacterium sp.]